MMQKRKRLLVTISISFSVRYIVRTGLLDMLKEFCEPVVIITWKQEDLINELRDKGFEVYVLPATKKTDAYENVRKKIDIWFKHYKLKKFSPDIERDYLEQYDSYRNKILKRAREKFNILKLSIPGYKKELFKTERRLLHELPGYSQLNSFVKSLDADAVFTVTPFHRQEDIFLRVCKHRRLQMITSILSFDNITKRGWIPVVYDQYMVWNKYNREELTELYPQAVHEKIFITGAPQFDFYFKEENLINKDEWLSDYNIAKGRKIILYGGGPASLFPNEPMYLKHIYEAIKTSEIKHNPVLLFRCHPIDNLERWKKIFADDENIIFDNSWTGITNPGNANITKTDIKKLCSALAYSDVHINVCSTMTVDGSAFNKPQVAPAYEITKKGTFLLRRLYFQQHFKPVLRANALSLATSREKMVRLINKALEQPESFTTNSRKLLSSIITCCDGRNTERVAERIKQSLYTD